MKVTKFFLSVSICILTVSNFLNAQTAYKPYSAYKQIPVNGDGSWDYLSVDQVNRRLYLSHKSKVDIVDIDKEKVIGEIGDQNGVHGIAVANPENKGFVSNGGNSQVTVFDLKSNKVLEQIQLEAKGMDAITYNPYLHYVIAHNSKSHSVTVIDAKTDKVIGVVEDLGKTEFGASDDKGFYYVNLEDLGQVAKIDLKTLKKVDVWSLAPDNTPAGMAIDITNHRLFSGARSNDLVVINTETGKIITTVPIGDSDDAVVYDPETKLIYVSSIQADVTIIKQESPDSYKVLQHVKTKLFSKTMALDKKTKKIYFSSADFDGTDEHKSKILPGTFKVLIYKN